MTTFFVTRHKGAVEWASRQGIKVDRRIEHIDLSSINTSDTVIGSLPVNLVAEVCQRGGRYIHLSIDLPREMRGNELTAEDMARCNARLEAYNVVRI